MINQATHLEASKQITVLELPAHVCGGLKSLKGEVYRDGPYLIRIDIEYSAKSLEKLEAALSYLVAALHYQEHGHFDNCPGSFQGHLAVVDPSGSRTFSAGWHLIHMWIEDNLLFHADGSLKAELFAAKLFEGRIKEALDALCFVDAGSEVGAINIAEASGSWLSYQLGQTALGTPIGMSTRFVGPNVHDIVFVRPADIGVPAIEENLTIR